MLKTPAAARYSIILYSSFVLAIALLPARVHAQAAQPPSTPAEPVEPAELVVAGVGEDYHLEVSVGAWFSMPSTVMYSDTETLGTGPTTSTTVTGTNIDVKNDLGLTNKVIPELHVTIRIAPKHKLRGEYMPLFYRQSATLAADLVFNGAVYLKGDTVNSSLKSTEWKIGYEFDALTFDHGYIGAIAAVSSLNVTGALADAAQWDTASVNIFMPGLGATARYYPRPNVSVTGEFFAFALPGSATSTHGHIFQVDGYATYSFTKHAGVQAGYRSFSTTHVWGSPLNTGSMTIHGPYVGGIARF